VSFYVSTATFILLHCDEWDCVVALPRHKFVTGATLLQLDSGLSWSWWYSSWIYDYLCNQCLSPLTLWVRIPLMAWCIRYIMW